MHMLFHCTFKMHLRVVRRVSRIMTEKSPVINLSGPFS